MKLKSVELEGKGRYYQSPTTLRWYPSVTTVVNHEMEDFWREWRKNPQNLAISKKALARGNRLHQVMEDYLGEKIVPKDPFDRMKFDLLKPCLDKITSIRAIEIPMWSDNILLAGRVDCIAEYDGKLAVVDFKTAGKDKTKDQILNYFHQTTAYAYMWNQSHEKEDLIERVVILIVTDDGTLQEFVESPSNYKKSMFDTIKTYWDKYSFREVQEIANEIHQATIQFG
jgi:genome maintenance exonuclease 1